MANLQVPNNLNSASQYVGDGTSNSPLSLRAGADSYVGLGTDSPQDKLHIAGGSIQLSTDQTQLFFLYDGQIQSQDEYHRIIFRPRNAVNTMEFREWGDLLFTPGARLNNLTPKVVMKDNGNLGVNQTSPGAKVEVKGDAPSPGSEKIALKLTDSDSVTMFEVVDDEDSNSKNVTVFRSLGGKICVVPKGRTAADIQACIDYLTALGFGGIVFLPGGDAYDLGAIGLHIGEGLNPSHTVSQKTGDGIQIIGAGPDSTKLWLTNATAATAIHIQGGQDYDSGTGYVTAKYSFGNAIKNLKIMLVNGDTDNTNTGIYNEYGFGLVVEDVQIMGIKNSGVPLRFQYGIRSSCWCVYMNRCHIWHTGDAGIAIESERLGDSFSTFTNGHANVIRDCDIEYFADDATGHGYGVWVGKTAETGDNAWVQAVNIVGTVVQNNNQSYGTAVVLDAYARATRISGCYFESTSVGVLFTSNEDNSLIGNYFAGSAVTPVSGAGGGSVLMANYNYNNVYFGRSVGIGTVSPGAALEVNGYTKLGSDAPKIKVKKLTGTTTTGTNSIPHGLNQDKIIAASMWIKSDSNDLMFPFNPYTNKGYNWRIDATNVILETLGSAVDANTYVITLTYEQ